MSAPTPTPTKIQMPAIFQEIIDFFKTLLGFDLNAILSAADPEIRKAAKELAEKASNTLPKDHWIRGDIANRVLSIFSSRIESLGKKQPEQIGDVLEKVSDFLDKFIDRFYELEGGHATTGTSRAEAIKHSDTFALLEERFLKNAEEMIRDASFKNIPKVKAGLAIEFKALMQLKALVEKELEPKPEPKKREVTLAQQLRPVNTFLDKTTKRWKADVKKQKRKNASQGSGVVGKILDAPWKTLGILFR